MTCEHIRGKLTAYHLGDLDAATTAAVRAHLAACRDCQASLREIVTTLDLLQDALAGTAPAQTTLSTSSKRRILDSAVASSRPAWAARARTWIFQAHPGLARAAGFALLLGLLWAIVPHARTPLETAELDLTGAKLQNASAPAMAKKEDQSTGRAEATIASEPPPRLGEDVLLPAPAALPPAAPEPMYVMAPSDAVPSEAAATGGGRRLLVDANRHDQGQAADSEGLAASVPDAAVVPVQPQAVATSLEQEDKESRRDRDGAVRDVKDKRPAKAEPVAMRARLSGSTLATGLAAPASETLSLDAELVTTGVDMGQALLTIGITGARGAAGESGATALSRGGMLVTVSFAPEVVTAYRQPGEDFRQLVVGVPREETLRLGDLGPGQSLTLRYELRLGAVSGVASVATVRVRYRRTDDGRMDALERTLLAPADVRIHDEGGR
ncbi:MAG: zf-HC2 domain-containing protein [Lentisphaerae bacterium]|nr:zf-HC2 domain-containing protein [Lentisphaerota bacterium]